MEVIKKLSKIFETFENLASEGCLMLEFTNIVFVWLLLSLIVFKLKMFEKR